MNIRKRFFLLLTIIGLMFIVTSCINSTDYVKVTFDEDTYEVFVGQTIELKPIVDKGSSVGELSFEYSSSDESIANYENGKLTGLTAGQVVIKVICNERPIAYDTAVVNVVKDKLPDVEFKQLPETIFKGEQIKLEYEFVSGYSEAEVTFLSAHPEIATIDENGIITGVSLGTAMLSAKVTDELGASRDYNFSITVIPSDFTITYELDGGENHAENPSEYNVLQLPIQLQEPTKEGYTFLGWYAGETKVEEIAEGTEAHLSFTAKWELDVYSISYNFDGGQSGFPWFSREEMVDAFLADAMAIYEKTEKPVNMTRFATVFGTSITKVFTDEPYAAKWGWMRDYIISVTTVENTVAQLKANSEAFWRYSIGAFLFKEHRANWPVSEDFTKEELNNGFWNVGVDLVEEYSIHSEDIVLPTAVAKKGYNFLGWFDGENKVTVITSADKKDFELVAKWEAIEYTITLDYNGMPLVQYLYESREAVVAAFIEDFKAITGVTLKSSATANGVAGTDANQKAFWDNDEMFAKWEWLAQYLLDTATAHGYNGVHDHQKAQYGDILNRVDRSAEDNYSWWTLRRDVYGFLTGFHNSWYASGGKVDWSKPEFNNGFWSYIVDESFVSPETEIKYTILDEVVLPTPQYGEWRFLGWYNEGEKIETIPAGTIGNITVVAKWYKPEAVFNIEYKLDGGKLPEGAPTTFVAKDGLAELPVPTQLGYKFVGWFADEACTQAVTSIEANVALEGVTIYAAWEEVSFNIEYELNGGEFQVDKVVPLYDSFEDLATDFINDYSTFTGITGVTATNFYGKSSQLGVYGFFKNEAMAAKWQWLLDFINDYAAETNYAGKPYLNISAGAANFNKYVRSNIAALLQHAKLSNITPVSLDFAAITDEELQTVSPTEEIKVGVKAETTYKISDLPVALATPYKEGATFVGWYLNANLKEGKVEAITEELIGDIKLYARWSDSVVSYETYKITYVLDGGKLAAGSPESYVEEQGAKLLDPSWTGYEFKGWFLDAECTKPISELTAEDKGDKTLYASWEAIEYKVSFEVYDGKLPTYDQEVGDYADWDDMVADLVADIQKVKGATYSLNYFVTHTSTGYNVFAATSAATTTFFNNAEMRAKWAWLIEFAKANREAAGLDVAQYEKLASEGIVAADAVTVNIEFVALIKGEAYSYNNQYFASDYSNAEIREKIWEHVEKIHTIQIVKDVTYTVADLPLELPEPTPAEGQKFFGWFLNAEFSGDPLTVIPAGTASDLKLYAKYVDKDAELKYEINYELDGGELSEGAPKEYAFGNALEISATASKLGYTFKGWFLDAGCTQAFAGISATQKGTVTLYAKWEANPVHNITYVLDGGQLLANAPATYVEGVGVTLVGASKQYHTFGGWFLNAECTGEAVTTISKEENKDITLYASWTEFEKKAITYVVNEGTLPTGAPTEYYVGVGLESLPTPTREGFNFLGWYADAECTGNAIKAISSEENKDITLYASWQDRSNVHTVTYNLNGGNLLYANREAVVADFLADMSTVTGVEITAANFRTKARQAQFTSFLADDEMWAKWEWLFKYVASCNKHEKGPAFYSEVLNKRTCTSGDWWFITRDFDGFVNKNVGDFYYSVSPIDYRLYENGDGFWSLIQTQYVDENALNLATPYRPYYKFEGWYSNADFTGEPVTSLEGDCVVYAKWSKETIKVTYVLGNANATLDKTVVELHASDSIAVLPTPKFNAVAYVFNGWFADEACTVPVLEIGQYQSKDINLYASWTENSGFTITYNLNGGNWEYSSREEVVDDFLADAMAFYEKTSKPNCMVNDEGVQGKVGFANVFTAIYTLFTSNKYAAKWAWLKNYIIATAIEGAKSYLEQGNEAYWRYSLGAFLFQTHRVNWPASTDYTSNELANGFWDELSDAQQKEFKNNKDTVTLPTPIRLNYDFGGWYKSADFTGEPVTTASENVTLYAKWNEQVPVESATITNKVSEIKRFATYQLEWSILPADAMIKDVVFESSDSSVAVVDEYGLITAVGCGTVTITMTSLSPTRKADTMSFNVYDPDHFEVSYETNSYVEIGQQIKLNAEYAKRDGSNGKLVWSSLNTDLASVDANGVVTGVAAGVATIRATVEGAQDVYFDFVVTVLGAEVSAAIKHAVKSHESNIFVSYNLGIGAGTPVYYADILGSISKIFYNHALKIDNTYLASGNATGAYYTDSTKNEGLEFVTVHYTGTMGVTADTDNIANNFTSSGTSVSIHYVTGNLGTYSHNTGSAFGYENGTPSAEVFNTLDHNHGAYHAGDSGSTSHSNSTKVSGTTRLFTWMPTGVKYNGSDLEHDLLNIVWTASNDFYYEINGQKTTIKLPETWNNKDRNTDHIYNADGTISAQPDYSNWGTTFSNRPVEEFFNMQGFPVTVIDGEYYMGPTWWSYGQTYEGRICGSGGNRNSIGIESCVNEGSDLWYTWQVTAQLVAKLIVDNDLDLSRVKGHHFFDGKDCPQPLLENNCEIWKEFLELVEAERELITTFKDAKFSMELAEEYDFVSEYGRITEQPEYTQIVEYTVTVEVNGSTETITLATAVNGIYTK